MAKQPNRVQVSFGRKFRPNLEIAKRHRGGPQRAVLRSHETERGARLGAEGRLALAAGARAVLTPPRHNLFGVEGQNPCQVRASAIAARRRKYVTGGAQARG